jgi:hypothetical protein
MQLSFEARIVIKEENPSKSTCSTCDRAPSLLPEAERNERNERDKHGSGGNPGNREPPAAPIWRDLGTGYRHRRKRAFERLPATMEHRITEARPGS